jgi:hypothetical protein
MEYEPFKVPRAALPTRAWSIYTPLPITSRYVKNAYHADYPRWPHGLSAMASRTLRVWIPTVKMRSQLLSELLVGSGGLSARTPRTVLQGIADRLWVGCGPSARSTRATHHTVCFEVNFGLSSMDPRTVRPKQIFLEKLCQKSQILNKPQRPADRPPQGPGLFTPQQKTDFSQDFQRNLFI